MDIAVSNGPTDAQQKVRRISLLHPGTWTLNKLTLNIGGRYDLFNAEVPRPVGAGGQWIQARNFAAIPNVPDWRTGRCDLGCLRPVRQRQDRAEGQRQQVHRVGRGGYAANFNGMTYSTQTRAWLDFDGNRSIFDSAGNIQFNEVIAARRTSDRSPASRSRARARL